MKYEICKGIKDKDSNIIWSAIAWSDVRPYAEDILYALSIAYIGTDNRFTILDNGKVIKES